MFSRHAPIKFSLVVIFVLIGGTLTARCQPPQLFAADGSWYYGDSLNLPVGTRIGSAMATPQRIRALIGDLGAGSTMYGSCTPTMSKGDLAAVELVKVGAPAVDELIRTAVSFRGAYAREIEPANRRWFAVQILGRIGDRRATATLCDCLLHEPDLFVRARAPRSLEGLHDPRSEDALLDALKDDYPDIQSASAQALGSLRSTRAVPALISLLGAPARMPAVNRNGMMGPQPISPASAAASALAKLGEAALPALRSARRSSEPQTRRFAGVALAGSASRTANADVRALLNDADAVVRLAAARGEAERRDRLAVPGLARLLRDDSPETRTLAAIALAHSGSIFGLKRLIAESDGAPESAGKAAAAGLRDVWDKEAADLLLAAATHGGPRTRLAAGESLLHWKEPRAVEPILRMARDPDPEVRGPALWLVNQLKDRRALPALLHATEDANDSVRVCATELLESSKTTAVVPVLLRRLTDAVELVRLRAIYGLAFQGNTAAVAPLQAVADHDNPRVREAALKAIQTIKGSGQGIGN